MEPYYTLAEQLYQVHGARGEDPTEPPRERALPVPRGQPRAAHPAALRRPRGRRPPPLPRALRRHARRGEHAVRPLRALRDLRRLPVPRAREVRRRGARGPPRARAPQRHAAHQRRGRAARDQRAGHAPSPAWSSTATASARRYAGDIVVVSCGAANSAKLLLASGGDAHPDGLANGSGPGRAQLHVPQQPGRAGALEGAQPDGLPEDARAQRLLPRRRRRRVPARQHPDGRQVVGGDVPRREADRRRSSRRSAR